MQAQRRIQNHPRRHWRPASAPMESENRSSHARGRLDLHVAVSARQTTAAARHSLRCVGAYLPRAECTPSQCSSFWNSPHNNASRAAMISATRRCTATASVVCSTRRHRRNWICAARMMRTGSRTVRGSCRTRCGAPWPDRRISGGSRPSRASTEAEPTMLITTPENTLPGPPRSASSLAHTWPLSWKASAVLPRGNCPFFPGLDPMHGRT